MKKTTKKKSISKKKPNKRHPSFGASWIRFAEGLRKQTTVGLMSLDKRDVILTIASEAEKEGKRLRGIKR